MILRGVVCDLEAVGVIEADVAAARIHTADRVDVGLALSHVCIGVRGRGRVGEFRPRAVDLAVDAVFGGARYRAPLRGDSV